mmetsp:Transcript_53750/g.114740  ORF Transcript_53750/g.114740 Transcript_53750/m.114740 type:complete len:83 (-) Transcript_53750:1091-1339(-)
MRSPPQAKKTSCNLLRGPDLMHQWRGTRRSIIKDRGSLSRSKTMTTQVPLTANSPLRGTRTGQRDNISSYAKNQGASEEGWD